MQESDSLKSIIANDTVLSLFNGHFLEPVNNLPIERSTEIQILPLSIILIALSILFYLIVSNQRKFILILRAFIQHSQARQLEREDYRINKGASLGLLIIFVIVTAAFFQQFTLHLNLFNRIDVSGFKGFVFLAIAILILYSIKILVNRLLSGVLNSYDAIREYLFNVLLLNKAVGLSLLPLTIALFFTQLPKEGIYFTGVILSAIFYCLRIVRGFSIGYSTRGLSAFHLFLYLCALEILPLAVILKLLFLRVL